MSDHVPTEDPNAQTREEYEMDQRAQELSNRHWSLVKHSISLPYPEAIRHRVEDDGTLALTITFEKGMWEEESDE